VAAASAALIMGSVPAYADNGPHISTATTGTATTDVIPVAIANAGQGRCASCHRAHTAKSAYLLNAADEESLCFSCHGGSGTGATTDVQNGVGYGTLTGALRGGGFQQAMLGTDQATKEIYFNTARSSWSSRKQLLPPATAPATTTSSHLGGVGTMWGNGAMGTATVGKDMSLTTATKLECTACHDPHGNKQYRILRPVPSDSGFTATLAGNTVPGIPIKDTTNKVYTTTNYWIAGDPAAVGDTGTTSILGATSGSDPTPRVKTVTAPVSSFQANVAAWCTTCHTRYLAQSRVTDSVTKVVLEPGSWETNSGDSVFTYRHTSDNVSGDAASNRNCIQCHVAHGTNAKMAANSEVENPGSITKTADSRLLRVDDRGTCVMCHNV
jgi:predicted CXXCH cytochrome family protein